jgi:MoxR-like ATPase
VLATQNPVEYHGTYPLPEAQLDRFAMLLEVGYPGEDEEIEIVLDQKEKHPLDDLEAVAAAADLVQVAADVRRIDVEPTIVRYMTELVRATRHDSRLRLGASTRAALILYRTCQALAFIRGRSFVIPDDVKELAVPVLAHRLILDAKASYSGLQRATVIEEVLAASAVPV